MKLDSLNLAPEEIKYVETAHFLEKLKLDD